MCIQQEEPSTGQPFALAQVRQFELSSGIPLRTAVRRDGWTEGGIEQMVQDRQDAAEWQEKLGDWMVEAFERGSRGAVTLTRPPPARDETRF